MENKKTKVEYTKYIKYINVFLFVIIITFILILTKKFYFNEFYSSVPSVVGYELKDAKKILKKTDLNIRNMGEIFSDLPYGTVAVQEPREQKIVKRNRNIKVWISKGNPVIFLENLVGKSHVEATSIIEREGLLIEEIREINSEFPINTVIATSPKTGEPFIKGEKISLIISK